MGIGMPAFVSWVKWHRMCAQVGLGILIGALINTSLHIYDILMFNDLSKARSSENH